jgi:shikimate dehydrogenase
VTAAEALDVRPRAAVLGAPIEHSLSPVLHRAAYRALGLDWSYDALRCVEADLSAFLADAAGFVGLSLTMPLKRAVLPLLDDVSTLAVAVGAANTVTFGAIGAGGRRTRRGDNTDVAGMVGAIRDRLDGAADRLDRVVILGGGGTAAAALGACQELAVAAVTVVVRDRSRADPLAAAAERLGITLDLIDWPSAAAVESATLLISTVPAGAADALVGGRVSPLHDHQLVFDVLYHPWPTDLASSAKAAGADVIDGLELLVRQAGVQVQLMTGRRAPIDAMREAGQKALNDRNSASY